MMTRAAAEAYGKRIGCKYYVMNDRGGLIGGFKNREDAEECKKRWEIETKNNPFDNTVKYYIKEK